jgi:hypothetical protein
VFPVRYELKSYIHYGLFAQRKNCGAREKCPSRNSKGIVIMGDVTRTAIAMEQLSKHVSKETNYCNNKRAVFSVQSAPKGYRNKRTSCKVVEFRDSSPPGQELRRRGIELRN